MDSILNKVNADRAAFNTLGNIYPADGSVEILGEPIDGVTCYWFVPDGFDKNKIVIYLHGGMFVLGSIETYKLWSVILLRLFLPKFYLLNTPWHLRNHFPME